MKEDLIIKQIGERLRDLRVKKGYSSHENFAYENDLGRVQYWRHENGTNMTIKSLIKLLNIHGVSLEEFFRGM